MTDYKTLFVAIAAKVVRGLPAPTGVSIHADGHVYLTLERIADVAPWLGEDSQPYDYRYEPSDKHPHGHRISGGTVDMLGTAVSVTASEELSDSDADEATVLAHVADEHDGPVDGCECEDCEDERERLQEVAASSG
jgi:hypothetical protein